MSEEILKALMQLFALVVKQYGGVPEAEREYVRNFLDTHLSRETAGLYMAIFEQYAGPVSDHEDAEHDAFPSVKDSLRILGICEKISRTLSQEKKIVVLIRLYEMVNAGQQFTPQRINILNTVAEVFRITSDEFTSIEQFIRDDDPLRQNRAIIFLDRIKGSFRLTENSQISHQGTMLIVLMIESSDLYFIRFISGEQLFLDGRPVKPGPVYLLSRVSSVKIPMGPSICFSEISSYFHPGAARTKISFVTQDVSISRNNEALVNISFRATEGKIAGIMGTEDSGKSLLLRILGGTLKPDSGSVRVNGMDIYQNPDDFEGIFSFIPHNDNLLNSLTVFRNFCLSARRSISGRTKQELSELVIHTLTESGLQSWKDIKAGMITGRVARKKLNIALGLISDPPILFIEDPFDGMLPWEVCRLMDFLRNLVFRGKLIFTLVNKPSAEIFGMLDQVVILDRGGYLVFSGKPADATKYFRIIDSRPENEISECPFCGSIDPEAIFSIIDARTVDELGNYTEDRKVKPREWATAFSSQYPFSAPAESGEKLSGKYIKPGRPEQMLIRLDIFLRKKLSGLKAMRARS